MNTMSLDSYIESLYQKALHNVKEHVEMLYIQAKSKTDTIIEKGRLETIKYIDEKLIENYLKKRGYTMNYILENRVMVKGFTVVRVESTFIEVWHDKIKNNKSVFVNESLLTGLPITLDYMERI